MCQLELKGSVSAEMTHRKVLLELDVASRLVGHGLRSLPVDPLMNAQLFGRLYEVHSLVHVQLGLLAQSCVA